MGGCLSDLRGGQQAVGGTQTRPNAINEVGGVCGGGSAVNDAVDFFNRSRGLLGLYTQLEGKKMLESGQMKKEKIIKDEKEEEDEYTLDGTVDRYGQVLKCSSFVQANSDKKTYKSRVPFEKNYRGGLAIGIPEVKYEM